MFSLNFVKDRNYPHKHDHQHPDIQEKLMKNGYKIKTIHNSGDSGPKCISLKLYGTTSHHIRVRREIV
jgi:N-dimethylarginine dimethylaminohydrolase